MMDEALWEEPSACEGWRVIDVLAHLAALATEAVDPPEPDPSWPKNRERYHDMRVDERRGWTQAQVIDEWRRSTPRQLALLAKGQDEAVADEPVNVPGLGVYPRHLLANTMAFNVFCHLRNDMLAPDGPLPFIPPEPTDGEVGSAVEFMLAGLPQMQGPELTGTVEAPLVLELTGPGARTVTISPPAQGGDRLTVEPGEPGEKGEEGEEGESGETRIRSSALDFIKWGTKRKPWRDYCEVTGDAGGAARFLDQLNIV